MCKSRISNKKSTYVFAIKANSAEKVFFYTNLLPSLRNFVNKKVGTVRNHVKLIHVVTSRRGFSKGTVLCGGY